MTHACVCVDLDGSDGTPAETVCWPHSQCTDSEEGQTGIASWQSIHRQQLRTIKSNNIF